VATTSTGIRAGETLRALVIYLRQQCNDRERQVFSSFNQVPKRDCNVLAQLADMCVGAVARSYRNDKDDPSCYRRIIAPRIENMFGFGKEP
jgi:hypothetical protein